VIRSRGLPRAGWRRRAGVTLLLGVLALLLLPATADGHAYLERSEPAAGAVLPIPPAEVQIWFTEPLEPAFTRAVLYDAAGQLVETPDAVVANDPYQLSLELPADLPDGAYTVQWENISTADGHPAEGFFSFTVGEAADVPPEIVTPELPADDGTGLLSSIGRWLGLLGVAAAVGSLGCWYWVLRPSVRRLSAEDQAETAQTARRLASAGAALSAIGVSVYLLDHVHDATGTLTFSTLIDFVRDTQAGTTLALRIGLVLLFGAMLASRFPWRVGGHSVDGLLAQGVGALVLFQFAQLTHATAQRQGEPAAVAAEWLHLAAVAVWIGGIFALVVVLFRVARQVSGEARRELLAGAITRFSTLAISAVVIVSLSGLYAGWVQIGSLDALWESDYGRTLLFKLALVAPILWLGALNLFVLGPALRHAAPRERDFGRTVRAEAALGAAVLFLAAVLASTPPPQPTQAAAIGGSELHLFAPGGHTILTITPSQVGRNEYIANVVPDDGGLPAETEVLLRIERDDQISGIREVVLEPSEPLDGTRDTARFEASGSELSVVGEWELELIVRRPGQADWRAESPLEVGAQAPAAPVAAQATRGFTSWYAAPLMVLAAGCIVATVVFLRRDSTSAAVVEGSPDPAD